MRYVLALENYHYKLDLPLSAWQFSGENRVVFHCTNCVFCCVKYRGLIKQI
jgi:hypothetical protein